VLTTCVLLPFCPFLLMLIPNSIKQYFALDDEKVRRVRISEVLAAKAYLLVYSRA
jgi:hypothetical protein